MLCHAIALRSKRHKAIGVANVRIYYLEVKIKSSLNARTRRRSYDDSQLKRDIRFLELTGS